MYACMYGGAKIKHLCMFNEGFFALRVCGAYIWRGLYMEGLIHGEAYFRNFAVFCQKNFENSELKQKFQL